MYINLVPINGRYRGVYRYPLYHEVRSQNFKVLYALLEKYWEWNEREKNIYSHEAVFILTLLKKELIARGQLCEIICYSDNPTEFQSGENFLGFDIFGNIGCSAIEEGNILDDYYAKKLNENGLFANHEDAKEFCDMWAGLIATNTSPYEVDENPRPFCIWLYQN